MLPSSGEEGWRAERRGGAEQGGRRGSLRDAAARLKAYLGRKGGEAMKKLEATDYREFTRIRTKDLSASIRVYPWLD